MQLNNDLLVVADCFFPFLNDSESNLENTVMQVSIRYLEKVWGNKRNWKSNEGGDLCVFGLNITDIFPQLLIGKDEFQFHACFLFNTLLCVSFPSETSIVRQY